MRFFSFLFILLLVYIIVALVFWGVRLDTQNTLIFKNELESLHYQIDSVAQPQQYKERYKEMKEKENTRKAQYLGEGVTFLLIILIGAGVVYSAMRSNMKLSRQQNNFILSITHELKSPIAAIKLNLETLNKRKLEEQVREQLINRSIVETNRLDDLCNNLLLASQMENALFKPSNEPINLSLLTNEQITIYQQRIKQTIVSNIEEGCKNSGDPLLWKLVISNLIENASKYSPADSTIAINLYTQDEELIWSIADQGIGIPDDEKQRIFKKFYRVGNENARKTKGTGLGLFLTSKIIHQHKASISVRDNAPKGSIFEISIPKVS